MGVDPNFILGLVGRPDRIGGVRITGGAGANAAQLMTQERMQKRRLEAQKKADAAKSKSNAERLKFEREKEAARQKESRQKLFVDELGKSREDMLSGSKERRDYAASRLRAAGGGVYDIGDPAPGPEVEPEEEATVAERGETVEARQAPTETEEPGAQDRGGKGRLSLEQAEALDSIYSDIDEVRKQEGLPEETRQLTLGEEPEDSKPRPQDRRKKASFDEEISKSHKYMERSPGTQMRKPWAESESNMSVPIEEKISPQGKVGQVAQKKVSVNDRSPNIRYPRKINRVITDPFGNVIGVQNAVDSRDVDTVMRTINPLIQSIVQQTGADLGPVAAAARAAAEGILASEDGSMKSATVETMGMVMKMYSEQMKSSRTSSMASLPNMKAYQSGFHAASQVMTKSQSLDIMHAEEETTNSYNILTDMADRVRAGEPISPLDFAKIQFTTAKRMAGAGVMSDQDFRMATGVKTYSERIRNWLAGNMGVSVSFEDFSTEFVDPNRATVTEQEINRYRDFLLNGLERIKTRKANAQRRMQDLYSSAVQYGNEDYASGIAAWSNSILGTNMSVKKSAQIRDMVPMIKNAIGMQGQMNRAHESLQMMQDRLPRVNEQIGAPAPSQSDGSEVDSMLNDLGY